MPGASSLLSVLHRTGDGGVAHHRRRGAAGEGLVPVVPTLASLLPDGGFRRGSTVTVSGSTSLLLTVLGAPSRAGAWCGVVGLVPLGVVAAAEAGVALDRLALVAEPGPAWPSVTAALLDAFDVVAVRPPGQVRGADARRLAARARERGSLLLPLGAWEGADARLFVAEQRWEGLGDGHGRLRDQHALVRIEGRGRYARPRQTWVRLPEPAGAPTAAAETGDWPALQPAVAGQEGAA